MQNYSSSQVGISSTRIEPIFGDIQISYWINKYSPASGGFVPRLKALDPVE